MNLVRMSQCTKTRNNRWHPDRYRTAADGKKSWILTCDSRTMATSDLGKLTTAVSQTIVPKNKHNSTNGDIKGQTCRKVQRTMRNLSYSQSKEDRRREERIAAQLAETKFADRMTTRQNTKEPEKRQTRSTSKASQRDEQNTTLSRTRTPGSSGTRVSRSSGTRASRSSGTGTSRRSGTRASRRSATSNGESNGSKRKSGIVHRQPLRLGSRVYARFSANQKYYWGRIVRISKLDDERKQYSVDFDDGDHESDIERHHVYHVADMTTDRSTATTKEDQTTRSRGKPKKTEVSKQPCMSTNNQGLSCRSYRNVNPVRTVPCP